MRLPHDDQGREDGIVVKAMLSLRCARYDKETISQCAPMGALMYDSFCLFQASVLLGPEQPGGQKRSCCDEVADTVAFYVDRR